MKRPTVGRLGLCLFILPCCTLQGVSFCGDMPSSQMPPPPTKAPAQPGCPTIGTVLTHDLSWALNQPFHACVAFTGASAAADVNSCTETAFVCYSYSSASCNTVPGTASLACSGADSARWPSTAISRDVARGLVCYTFKTFAPHGTPEGTGKGIVIITKNVGSAAVQYSVGGTMTINNPTSVVGRTDGSRQQNPPFRSPIAPESRRRETEKALITAAFARLY
jgi:hypothetical protein